MIAGDLRLHDAHCDIIVMNSVMGKVNALV